MADDIVTRLRLRAAHATDDYLSYAAADEIERLCEYVEELRSDRYEWVKTAQRQEEEIERLRALIVGFATAHSNRQGNVGGGVETWNALARATDALLAEAERQGASRD